MTALTVDDREKVRKQILEASEPIAPFLPMKTFIAQIPFTDWNTSPLIKPFEQPNIY